MGKFLQVVDSHHADNNRVLPGRQVCAAADNGFGETKDISPKPQAGMSGIFFLEDRELGGEVDGLGTGDGVGDECYLTVGSDLNYTDGPTTLYFYYGEG